MSATPTQPVSFALTILRSLPLILLGLVLGAGAAALASFTSTTSYTGSAVFLVPPTTPASTSTGLTPYDAERLARTYAVVIAEDDTLLQTLGERSNGTSRQPPIARRR